MWPSFISVKSQSRISIFRKQFVYKEKKSRNQKNEACHLHKDITSKNLYPSLELVEKSKVIAHPKAIYSRTLHQVFLRLELQKNLLKLTVKKKKQNLKIIAWQQYVRPVHPEPTQLALGPAQVYRRRTCSASFGACCPHQWVPLEAI